MRIIVVEDNHVLAQGIASALTQLGAAVDIIGDGIEAQEILATQHYDLIVLDVMLPGCDGLSLLAWLRKKGIESQVLILTARDQLSDRVQGLDQGADDYLTKPFELVELQARCRALLRRAHGQKAPIIEIDGFAYDTIHRSVSYQGQVLHIPKRETSLLHLFLTHIGQVISKEQIVERLANFEMSLTDNNVELYVSRLRKKISDTSLKITTIRGIGYILEKK